MKPNLEAESDGFLHGVALSGGFFIALPFLGGVLLLVKGMWPLAVPVFLAAFYLFRLWACVMDEIERRR